MPSSNTNNLIDNARNLQQYEDALKEFNKYLDYSRDIDQLKYFNPFRLQPKEEPLLKGFPVMFITTPKLYLNKTNNLTRTGFFKYMADVEPDLLSLLNFGGASDENVLSTGSPFIKILSNQFNEISITGVASRTKEFHETFYGYKQLFPTAMIDSVTANTISVTYSEDRNMNVTKLHKAWMDYIEYCRRGIMTPSMDTIISRSVDFTSSIYYFVLDFDFETILFYSKYTGCAPISIPYDSLSNSFDGGKDVVNLTIEYAFCYKEDLDPNILLDFNCIANSASKLNNRTSSVSKLMYTSTQKSDFVTLDVDLLDTEYFSKITSASVVFENYGDNTEKKRYKLKFFNDNDANEVKDTTNKYTEDYKTKKLADKSSTDYSIAKQLATQYSDLNKEIDTLNKEKDKLTAEAKKAEEEAKKKAAESKSSKTTGKTTSTSGNKTNDNEDNTYDPNKFKEKALDIAGIDTKVAEIQKAKQSISETFYDFTQGLTLNDTTIRDILNRFK